VFALRGEIETILSRERFDQWNRANPTLPFDELVFFADRIPKVQAIPYENVLLIYKVSAADIRALRSIDHRLVDGLYTLDMRPLR
jgi:hypothetical protein